MPQFPQLCVTYVYSVHSALIDGEVWLPLRKARVSWQPLHLFMNLIFTTLSHKKLYY